MDAACRARRFTLRKDAQILTDVQITVQEQAREQKLIIVRGGEAEVVPSLPTGPRLTTEVHPDITAIAQRNVFDRIKKITALAGIEST